MKFIEKLSLIVSIAIRNLWLYRVKTLIIGALLGFGTFLAVFGLSLLQDVESSMRASIIESVAGHLQIYSDKAKDDLALFGGGFMGRQEVGTLPNLAQYREEVLKHPNVEAFIPMGIDMSLLGRGNEMDESLDALRAALKANDPSLIHDRVEQVKFQIEQLKKEVAEQRKISLRTDELQQQENDLAAVSAAEYFNGLTSANEDKLQFLETRIAPISGEKNPIYLMYIGTDIELFKNNFSKFKVVDGEVLPPGKRGILIGHKIRETQLKNLVARLFDKINKRITKTKIKIEGDDENQRDATDLKKQYSQLISHLDRVESEELSKKLTDFGIAGDDKETDLIARLTGQLKEFLNVNDENFSKRFDWFYANIAPKIKLYEISPGETLTLRNYTRSGYVKSIPVKVYGVYSFEGLEDSDLAGAMNIIDLVTFRELYGQMTESSRKELEEMRSQIGIKDVSVDNVEDALFGGEAPASIEGRSLETQTSPSNSQALKITPMISDAFDANEIQDGLALNAALKLKDPSKLQATRQELEDSLKAKGLTVRVVDWQKASGIIGQFVNIVGLVLVFAIVVIFIVALVIINNSIIVGTLNRFREIGTMRAIGAQKTFVVGMFLGETGITGLIGSIFGAIFAGLLLIFLGKVGIPAGNDVVTFLFSGPRLFPSLQWALVLFAPVVVTIIATLASIYAARHAAHVQPAEAMQEKE